MYAKLRGLMLPLALCAGLMGATAAWGALNVNVLDLDGNGDYVTAVDANNLTDFSGGAFTIQAWTFCQNLNSNRPIISKYVEAGDQRSWALIVTNQGQLRAYISGDGTVGNTLMWQTVTSVVTSDVWNHIAFVCDPAAVDKIKFYVNNVECAHTNGAVDPPAALFNSTADVWVGRFLTQYFYGYIDELRITEGALASFPASPLDLPLTPDASTMLLYHFDEALGNVHDHGNIGNPTNLGYLQGGATRRAWDGLGPENDLPLPVSLVALTAAAASQNVTICWITETEIDNLGFHLYRSTNENAGFSRITSSLIPSQGFSSTSHQYEYVDERDLVNGVTYYYKIADVDVNGRERQHETIASATPLAQQLEPGQASQLADYILAQNYPNPFNAATTIHYYLREAGLVRLSVLNLAGEEIALLVNQAQSAGEHSLQFDASAYPAGIYFLRLTGENGYDNIKKMLFLK
ncbi:MAG: T9SS C-terminal target domain-containing protein [Candidatus Zixiibacteriota bacterium]|nr:MAG: T9SS C-terminal target domain-containing protein [candidate division Zixibacteria bacterium]